MIEDAGKTKYFLLMEQLKEDMASGKIKPGDKLPSENELSARENISRHTVRKAFSILEQEGYVEAIHGKGTFCVQRMRHTGNSKNIAVVTTYISDYIFPRLIQGMDKVLTAQGYSIILKNTNNSRVKEAAVLEELLTKDIDGMIIEPSKSQMFCKHTHLYQEMERYQIPYVFIQGIFDQMEEHPHILMDDCRGGYLVTQHLISLGHKKIAGVFKADDTQGKQRHKGYVLALQEAGIAYDPDLVIWFHTEDRKKKPAMMIQKMVSKQQLDGVVCYNDQIAVEVIKTLERLNLKVPEDISVTGYDDSAIAVSDGIQLTTIAHPQEKLGEMAAELLLELLRGIPEKESQVTRLIRPELIIRNSCRKNRGD